MNRCCVALGHYRICLDGSVDCRVLLFLCKRLYAFSMQRIFFTSSWLQRRLRRWLFSGWIAVGIVLACGSGTTALSQPNSVPEGTEQNYGERFAGDNIVEEIPEEILRTEIITGARSPLTGEVLSAAEYAQIQAALAAPAGDTLVRDDIQYLIFLLQFRRAVRPIIPFL